MQGLGIGRCTPMGTALGRRRRDVLVPLQPGFRRTSRQEVRTEAGGGVWSWLRGAFKPFDDGQVPTRKKAASELLRLLTTTQEPDLSRVNELLDELINSEGQKFSEKQLGGGPWVVRFTRGKPFLWNITYSTGRLINNGNRASQDFNPTDRSATNLVEINGPDSFIAAYGAYEPVDDSAVTPKTIRARISSGRLVAWGLDLPLPVAGTGLFDVMYVDESLRVFRSSSRYAVQVRADRLPDA